MVGRQYRQVVTLMIAFLFLFSSLAMGSVLKEEDKKEILNKAHKLHVPFIENRGQVQGGDVAFYAKTFGGTLFVTKNGDLVYSLPRFIDPHTKTPNSPSVVPSSQAHIPNPKSTNENPKPQGWVIKESLVGGSVSQVKGEDKAVTKVSCFKGKAPSKWKTGISTYSLVSLGEVYKGIEVKLKAHGKNVEKLFYVRPDSDVGTIRVEVEGAEGLRLNKAGQLEVETALSPIRFTKPLAYQMVGGEKKTIEAAYVICKGNTYGFKVGNYDKKRPLIIDPVLASTFIGGSSEDGYFEYTRIAIDGDGNVYVTGDIDSSDFPTTSGAYDETHNGGDYDIFISKLDSSLSTLLASTFIGGSNGEHHANITIDGNGGVYICGGTDSSDFPTTSGAYDESYNGWDFFVSKLDSNLSILLESTFVGGSSSWDHATSISLDGYGNVYLTGKTASYNYPTTSGAYDESHNGDLDAFVSKLDSSLSTLLASTFIGGASEDEAESISLDGDGNVYITGNTESSDYPTTAGAYDESYNGNEDVCVSKLNSNLSTLLASTFIGTTSGDEGDSIAVDGVGNVYVFGGTDSSDYPTTSGAYDESHNGNGDVYVSKLDSNLSTLLASTFIGGSDGEGGDESQFILDGSGNVYVTHGTSSSDYPTTAGAYDESYNGNGDVYISKLDSSLSTLLASTFIGGGNSENSQSIAIDRSGNIYISGVTSSSDYPTTSGAYDESYNGGNSDVFISKLDSELSAPAIITPTSHDFGIIAISCTSTQPFTIQNVSQENLQIDTISITGNNASEFGIHNDTCSGQTLTPSGTCTFDAVFGPATLGSKEATVNIPFTDPDINDLDVPLSGLVTELCEGDFADDNDVDGSDLAIFAADFGRTDCDQGDPCEGNFDGDNDIDGSDLAVFAADFGRTDCPDCP